MRLEQLANNSEVLVIGAGLAGGNWDIIEQCIQHMWIQSQFEGKLVVYNISNRGTHNAY